MVKKEREKQFSILPSFSISCCKSCHIKSLRSVLELSTDPNSPPPPHSSPPILLCLALLSCPEYNPIGTALQDFSILHFSQAIPMRIRRKSSFISSSQSSSFSFPSLPSSASSSSSITASSLASSTDSSSSIPPNLLPYSSTSAASRRCQGLDLLVKAIHLVTAGSVVGVPYIQRRVVQRRRRALKFTGFIIRQLRQEDVKEELHIKTRSMLKRQSRMMGLP